MRWPDAVDRNLQPPGLVIDFVEYPCEAVRIQTVDGADIAIHGFCRRAFERFECLSKVLTCLFDRVLELEYRQGSGVGI